MAELPYTEFDTQRFYDTHDGTYRAFWDASGALHWGLFHGTSSGDDRETWKAAHDRSTGLLADLAGLGEGDRVLDLGCGNGTVARWIRSTFGCSVLGIDLSTVRIRNARRAVGLGAGDPAFLAGSASALPFADRSFTHVWSQAVLYHVQAREEAIAEIARVLRPDGFLVLDDLVTPVDATMHPDSVTHVYERLMFEPGWDPVRYAEILGRHGLYVDYEDDLTPHLLRSYEVLTKLASGVSPELARAFTGTCEAIERGDVGWHSMRARRITDPVEWVYRSPDRETLRQRYDVWAGLYDKDLAASYGHVPRAAAEAVANLPVDPGAVRVLDAGCGTGLVGRWLWRRGVRHLTGVDLSEGMLVRARGRQIYELLVPGDIVQDCGLENESFDVVCAIGLMTFGHADASALPRLFSYVRPGGHLVWTLRPDYVASSASVQRALAALPGSEVSRTQLSMFDDERIDLLVFQKPG